jgi:hypothetical protein
MDDRTTPLLKDEQDLQAFRPFLATTSSSRRYPDSSLIELFAEAEIQISQLAFGSAPNCGSQKGESRGHILCTAAFEFLKRCSIP